MNKEHFEKNRERIARLRPIDDTFFEKIAESVEVCQEMLRVFLNDKELTVLSVVPQKSVKNLQGRSVRLDAYCIMGDGKSVNVEVQRSGNEEHLKRVRYNASCITANITDPGEKFQNVPNVLVVYISETDIFKAKKTVYHIDHVIREKNEIVDNGLQQIFINAAIDDGSEIAELMQCFLQTEVNNKKFPKLSERVYYFKNDKEGVRSMCKISEEIRKEGETIKLIELICKKIQKNKSLEQISDDLEEDLENLRPIYDAAYQCAPEYDYDRIYDIYIDRKNMQ